MSSGSAEASGGIRKKLGLLTVFLIGLALVNPWGPVPVYGAVQPITGGHMAIAYLIALVPMVFVAYVYGIFAAEFPRAGASYTFAAKGLHPYVGFIAGWAIILDYCLIPLMCVLFFGIFFNILFPAVNIYLIRAICLAAVLFLNLRSIKGVAKVNNVLTIFSAAMVVYFVIAAINVLAGGDFGVTFTAKAFYNPETFSWSTIGQGAAIACFSFLGFDALTTLAEETDKPERTLPRALILICLVMAVIYVVVAYLSQCLWPDFLNFSDPSAAIFDPIFVAGGQILLTLVLICQVVGMFAIALDMMAGSTRLMFAMGRDGALPEKFFGHENPKTHVPTYNVILLTAVTAAFIWVDVNVVCTLITFGALFAFVLVNLSAIRYFFFIKKVHGPGKIITHFIFPIVGFITSVYLWLSLGAAAQKLGFSWIAVGVIYLAIRTKGFRKPIDRNAAEVDAQFAQAAAAEKQAEAASN